MGRQSFNNITSLYDRAYKPGHHPRKYYAFIEKIEDIGEGLKSEYFIRFDCLMETEARSIESSPVISVELLSEIPFIHIECFEPEKKWRRFLLEAGLELTELEDQWVMIETKRITNPEENLLAEEFYNGEAQTPDFQLVFIKPNEEQKTRLTTLKAKLDLNKIPTPPNPPSLTTLISNALTTPDVVLVVDVGQGNLNVVTSKGIPKLYFDLGGGSGKHTPSYPKTRTIKTCQSQQPIVILSHWHMDHIETAIRDNSNCNLDWIVPYQAVGKTHFTLASTIASQGTLTIWPAGTTHHTHANGEIVTCTGTSKNDSGLAAFIFTSGQKVLLPGDAAYASITNIANHSFTCLVCSHHGSNSSRPNIPVAGGTCIAYSFGKKNKYHHPTNGAITDHRAQGWTQHKDSPNDTIVFDTKNYNCPCINKNCNLSSSQHY